MSGQTAFDKLVRLAALRRCEGAEDTTLEEYDERELNGAEEGQDGRSDEGGGRVDGEEDLSAPGLACEGRAQKQTDTEGKRRVRSNTRTVQRLVFTLHDEQRAHPSPHHQTKESEGQSRRPTVSMDYCVMKMKFVVNAQTMSEESITGIAVRKDRHQNSMKQCCVDRGSRRTADNRKGGDIQ